MAWREIIYQYDGSFEGLLCCVFESYTKKERPTAILRDGDDEPSLFEIRAVTTDRPHAQRIYRSLYKRSPEVGPFLRRAFLTCLPDKEMAIYRFIVKFYREGAPLLSRLSDDTYLPLLKAVRQLSGEVEQFRGFTRFSDFDGVLGAEIEPKNRVLPVLRRHFCERYHNETFFLYDRTHREALLYSGGVSRIVPLNHFEMAQPDEVEAGYRRLWRRFYDTVAIEARKNEKLRMTHMPKRYWGTMTEFQDESYFKARPKETPSASPAPRYLHLRHAQKARRLLLRQPLKKAQQDRHFFALGELVDGLAQCDALNEPVLGRLTAQHPFKRQAVARFALQAVRRSDRQLTLRDLLGIESRLLRKLGERRFAPECIFELFARGEDRRRLLTHAAAHLDCAVIAQKASNFARNLRHSVG